MRSADTTARTIGQQHRQAVCTQHREHAPRNVRNRRVGADLESVFRGFDRGNDAVNCHAMHLLEPVGIGGQCGAQSSTIFGH
jgi:hypothetical protein